MLELEKLNIKYPGSSQKAVKDLSLSLERESFCGLIGESGSGKSTVLMSIMGLLPKGTELTGSIRFQGKELTGLSERELSAYRQRQIALVPQGALNSFTPVFTIGRHIEEVLEVHLGIKGKAAKLKSCELLEAAELPAEIASRYPHELSGGQKQRAAIATALACEPSLILADEPTTALDVITQASVLKLLQKLRKEKQLTVLLVTHDLPLAASVCDSLFVMKDGLLIEQGSPAQLIAHPTAEHTKALIRAML